jgi:hypothetical protein
MRIKVTEPGTLLPVLIDEQITDEQFDLIRSIVEYGATGVGALNLPFRDVGEIVQAMCRDLIDRGHTREEILAALEDWDEVAWWGTGGMGRLMDAFEEELFPPKEVREWQEQRSQQS